MVVLGQMHPQKREKRNKEIIPANNLFAILIVLFMITSVLSSYLAYSSSKEISQELTGKAYAQARVCINKGPTILQSCGTTGIKGTGYYCDVDATDPENDTITFYDDTALFDIDQNTGEIIFTPNSTGAYSILLTASDGKGCTNSNTTSTLAITISEPPIPGGGGGGGTEVAGRLARECTPQWECTPWERCGQDGTTTRNCHTLNNCPTDKPAESQECIYLLPPREKAKQFYLCNFDQKDECFASFGMNEDWVYTYKAKDSVINMDRIAAEGADIIIDNSILFFAALERIKPVDVTGDKIEDFEYIVHKISGGRAEITVRKVKQVEVVVERPIYIEKLPVIIMVILMFIYGNLCSFILVLMVLAAMLTYALIMREVEKKEEKRKK
jgi:hypothetical protein